MTTPDTTRVFTGEWLITGPGDCLCHQFREGHAGTWAGHWNGWAVFTVTAAVMRVIVNANQNIMLHLIAEHTSHGATAADAWLHAYTQLPSLHWIGDLVVVDSRGTYQDPPSSRSSHPKTDGCYKVGFGWTWDEVDPTYVHAIHTGQTVGSPASARASTRRTQPRRQRGPAMSGT